MSENENGLVMLTADDAARRLFLCWKKQTLPVYRIFS